MSTSYVEFYDCQDSWPSLGSALLSKEFDEWFAISKEFDELFAIAKDRSKWRQLTHSNPRPSDA